MYQPPQLLWEGNEGCNWYQQDPLFQTCGYLGLSEMVQFRGALEELRNIIAEVYYYSLMLTANLWTENVLVISQRLSRDIIIVWEEGNCKDAAS